MPCVSQSTRVLYEPICTYPVLANLHVPCMSQSTHTLYQPIYTCPVSAHLNVPCICWSTRVGLARAVYTRRVFDSNPCQNYRMYTVYIYIYYIYIYISDQPYARALYQPIYTYPVSANLLVPCNSQFLGSTRIHACHVCYLEHTYIYIYLYLEHIYAVVLPTSQSVKDHRTQPQDLAAVLKASSRGCHRGG